MKIEKILFSIVLLSNICFFAYSQSRDVVKKTKNEIHFFTKNSNNRKVEKGDFLLYQLILKNDLDSIVIDTWKEFGEQQLEVTKSEFRGDLMAGLKQCNEGDSVLFLISANKLYKKNIPFFAHSNTCMKFYFKINHVFSKEELTKHQQAISSKQLKYDDSVLTSYFSYSKNIPTKIKNGLYIDLKQKGIGGDLRKGDSVKVNYSGKLVSGELFDSNIEKRFGHVEPFQFVLGVGSVIKGWDESLMLMQRGAKATIFIASPFAYGAKKMGAIPANSILIFDIEISKYK